MAKKFELGQILATPGAMAVTMESQRIKYLARHVTGDWGCGSGENKHANDEALKTGGLLLSAYAIDPRKTCLGYGPNCLWIITEADRSATMLLLPDEYQAQRAVRHPDPGRRRAPDARAGERWHDIKRR